VRHAPEIGVLIDAGRDERMRDLQQERGGAAKQDEHLAVDPSRDRIGGQEPVVAHR
jgi:hypothetical protein